MTICCEGMTLTAALEEELSSRTKENEAVKLRDGEGSSLLLMRDTVMVLGDECTTSPNIDL